ncbi:MAG: EAL domain-containing protein [Sphingomonadaceae bacterium]|nr:EAL domain-containing protein [Sphingomonadaceae bacterium]
MGLEPTPDPGLQTLLRPTRSDRIAGAVALIAIGLFAISASQLMSGLITGQISRDNSSLAAGLLLNIALIIFGWRRYTDIKDEISRRAASEERAQALAARDPLTGFLNRRAVDEAASALLSHAGKRRKALAMLVLDLDCFKQVNDLHGHDTGDQLLQGLAERIADCLPPTSVRARLGGDEFALAFLFDPENPAVVESIAARMIERMAEPCSLDGLLLQTTASIGLARSDIACTNIEALMRRADIAMYAAKKQGKNRFVWFDPVMERELDSRNQIVSGMRKGIPAGEFVPYYEQQIDLATGRLHGFEALARWNHPTRGVIMPEVFIPIAEETGLIAELSLSVMRQAFEEARDWDPSLTVSVNISPGQLRDPWLAQKIVKLLTETGMPPARLEIEITETSLFENLGLAQSIIGSLKNQGIGIALDDFGTGYSSLAHLRALPFDRIKIDRSFITSINDNSDSAAIVDAITRLSESLGLPITAEGIEDARIRERLIEIGSMKGQGWHYGKPMTADQTRRMLAEQGLLNMAGAEEAAEAALEELKRLRRA